MARNKLKIDQLAKLRQYKNGDNISEFLSTQFRQIVRALEQAYVDPTDLSNYPTLDQVSSDISSAIGNFQTKPDLYATNVSSLFIGAIPFAQNKLNSGSIVSGNRFFPSSAGKYWVDYGMEMTPGIAGTVTNSLDLITTNGITISTLSIRVETTIGGPKYVTGRSFVDLNASLGAYFEFNGNANTVGFNFYCSFTKVS